MMSMKVGLARLLRKQRLVACEKTNMGKLEVHIGCIKVVFSILYLSFLAKYVTLCWHEIGI